MKQIVKLIANNNKGFNFIKKNGSYHQAKVKKQGLLITTRTKKILVKADKDKRFIVEKPIISTNIHNSEYIDYSE